MNTESRPESFTVELESLFHARDELPTYLYRVQYKGSMTSCDPTSGLSATAWSQIDSLEHLRSALLSHATWERTPSPFISVFDDQRHARNWALARNDPSVQVIVLQARALPALRILRAIDVYRKLSIDVPPYAQNAHDYLCLHHIPIDAMVRVQPRDELQSDRDADNEARLEARYEEAEHHRRVANNDPHYRYDVEFGWFDSADESELRNTNDDLMKMMEDSW